MVASCRSDCRAQASRMLLLPLLAVLHHQPGMHKGLKHIHCHLQDQGSTIWDFCTNNAGKCDLFFGFSLLYETVQCFVADTDLFGQLASDSVKLMPTSLQHAVCSKHVPCKLFQKSYQLHAKQILLREARLPLDDSPHQSPAQSCAGLV